MESLEELLERRAHRSVPWYRRGSILGAIVIHVAVVLAALMAPTLLADKAPPREFVSIRIVPAAALGQRAAPPPAPPRPVASANPTRALEKSRNTSRAAEPARVVQRQTRQPAQLPTEVVRSEPPTTSPDPTRQGSPQGSVMATGGQAEISGFDDPLFDYGYYADLMLSRIRAQWERPPLGGEVEMVIHFRIRSDGAIGNVKILRSSGYNSFDHAGLRAVQRAKMPPLPKSYRSSSLGVRLVIR